MGGGVSPVLVSRSADVVSAVSSDDGAVDPSSSWGLVDSAPLLAVSDSIPLLSVSDGVVVVMRLGQTTRDSGRRVIELLDRVHEATLLGIVANDADACRIEHVEGRRSIARGASPWK